jgi:V8-like Glu-specific endopeptidase
MKVRSIVALSISALVLGVGVVFSSLDASASTTNSTIPAGTPTATIFRGTPTVGALFPPRSPTHACTASVVSSPQGNLLLTAAHCVLGTVAGYTFAPGYHDGVAPFGYWTVTKAYGSSSWTTSQNPQADVAFLVVAPQLKKGQKVQIQSVTGANKLGTAPPTATTITVPAYPFGSGGSPLTCTTQVYYSDGFPAFNCNPYVDGTSGSPWLVKTPHGDQVVGVIGGLHQGGCEAWTSYSAGFNTAIQHVYNSAIAKAPPTTFPHAGSDGCTTGL